VQNFSTKIQIHFFILALLFTSCSNQKNTIVNRTYHNTTARYNGYFNAKESVKEGDNKIKTGHVEDYTNVLPIFIFGDAASARSVYPQMDIAIEKCTDVIQNHSMYIKKKEYCKWIDDSYLLIGIANFYKREYDEANKMFEYVAKEYKDNPIKFDAFMWLAQSYIATKNYSKANTFLNLAESDSEFPDNKKALLKTIRADYYVKQGIIDPGIVSLQSAISLTKNKKKKVRLTFILAQLYQQKGDNKSATKYYAQVSEMHPPYEMLFYANINQAMLYTSGGSQQIKAKLFKMLNDEKNKEFKDQIYYALSELEFKDKNKEKGIEYLELSAASSTDNKKQKTKSFLKLAELYYAENNYIPAQKYYDSTVVYIDKSRADYNEILNIRNTLTRIVKNINIVSREDSLQRLAKLSDKEINQIIDKIIKEITDKEERERQEKMNQQLNAMNQQMNQPMNQQGGGAWYFYNPTTVSFGKNDFQKKWGDVKLEDNWRRKDKMAGANFEDNNLSSLESAVEKDTSATARDLKSRAYYLKNIPKTEKDLEASHEKIINALYDLGFYYKEDLGNINEAIYTFENLVSRYDDSKFHLNTYYQLYRIYLDQKNTSKADYYKNLILNKHPDSQYAILLKNPDYLTQLEKKSAAVNNYYEGVYNDYKKGYYTNVIASANKSDSLFPGNEIQSKFYYIKALSYKAINDSAQFVESLKIVVDKNPQSQEGKVAKKTLDGMFKKTVDSAENDTDETGEAANANKYSYKADAKHYFILVASSTGFNVNEAKSTMSDFHNKFYRQDGLKISSIIFDKETRMIVTKEFSNVFKAKDYYQSFTENTDMLSKINKEKLTAFIISVDNYAPFYKEKDLEGYQQFFIDKYK
jgi:TolA-binding protein